MAEHMRTWSVLLVAVGMLVVASCSGQEPTAETEGTEAPVTLPQRSTTSTAPIDERLDIEIAASGLTQMPADAVRPEQVTYAVALRNPNDAWIATKVLLNVELYDAAGNVVLTHSPTVPVILPGFPNAAAATVRASNVDRMEVKAIVDKWVPADPETEWGTLAATDVVFSIPGVSPPTVTGQLTSTWSEPVKNLRLVEIEFAEDGSIVGGDEATMSFVPADGTNAFSMSLPRHFPETVRRVEVVASPSSLQSIGVKG